MRNPMTAVARYGKRHGRRRHGIGSFFKKIGSGFKKAAEGVKKGVTWVTSDGVKDAVRKVRQEVAKHASIADMVVPGASDKIKKASSVLEQAGYGMRIRPLVASRRRRLYTRARSYPRRR